VPAFPGAQKTAATRGDCLSFQQRACSRPPLPTTKPFNALTLITREEPLDLDSSPIL
jgi:hypothetical protein